MKILLSLLILISLLNGGEITALRQNDSPNYLFVSFTEIADLDPGTLCYVKLEKVDKEKQHLIYSSYLKFTKTEQYDGSKKPKVGITVEVKFDELKDLFDVENPKREDFVIDSKGEYRVSFGTHDGKTFKRFKNGTVGFWIINQSFGESDGISIKIGSNQDGK